MSCLMFNAQCPMINISTEQRNRFFRWTHNKFRFFPLYSCNNNHEYAEHHQISRPDSSRRHCFLVPSPSVSPHTFRGRQPMRGQSRQCHQPATPFASPVLIRQRDWPNVLPTAVHQGWWQNIYSTWKRFSNHVSCWLLQIKKSIYVTKSLQKLTGIWYNILYGKIEI